MTDLSSLDTRSLASFVCSTLEGEGIDVVLSGGACVAIHSDNRYVSRDLDFINIGFTRRAVLRVAMRTIGFEESGRHFVHPDTDFVVEFPAGPLAVGEFHVVSPLRIHTQYGSLKLLSPQDCVKDRLTWFIHAQDRQCLVQAAMVYQSHTIDLEDLRAWVQGEHGEQLWEEIVHTLTSDISS